MAQANSLNLRLKYFIKNAFSIKKQEKKSGILYYYHNKYFKLLFRGMIFIYKPEELHKPYKIYAQPVYSIQETSFTNYLSISTKKNFYI